ncbi:hypothetical protein L9F63_017197 [Diploptera punctata]|uniref:EF-hand domain-containing protein n=1 Tax=Diploptera punctata TaxID=6984 RepID=A0AAD7ZZG8_DIPPU|nr:hypothetical protein L9F63_017197 [Diploptera punctata]
MPRTSTGIESQVSEESIELYHNPESRWLPLFKKYDKNDDGRISHLELEDLFKNESSCKNVPKRKVQKILRKADADGSDHLELDEFIKMMEQDEEVKEILKNAINKYINVIAQPGSKSQRGKYEEQYSWNPPPFVMILISLLEITSFLLDTLNKAPSSLTEKSNDLGPAGIIFIYDPSKRYEIWRYITYAFVHFSVFHLVFNLVIQIMLGIALEMVHGWWRVLIVYLAGVLAGSLGTSISDPFVYLGGASGGVYAFIAAHLATICMNWAEMGHGPWQLLIFLPLMAIDTSFAIYKRFVKGVEHQTGYAAHLAGALAGLLVGINVLRNLEVKSWENKLWWASVFVYTVLMLIAIIWNIAFPSYFPPMN